MSKGFWGVLQQSYDFLLQIGASSHLQRQAGPAGEHADLGWWSPRLPFAAGSQELHGVLAVLPRSAQATKRCGKCIKVGYQVPTSFLHPRALGCFGMVVVSDDRWIRYGSHSLG